jgi:hypothetical protein
LKSAFPQHAKAGRRVRSFALKHVNSPRALGDHPTLIELIIPLD